MYSFSRALVCFGCLVWSSNFTLIVSADQASFVDGDANDMLLTHESASAHGGEVSGKVEALLSQLAESHETISEYEKEIREYEEALKAKNAEVEVLAKKVLKYRDTNRNMKNDLDALKNGPDTDVATVAANLLNLNFLRLKIDQLEVELGTANRELERAKTLLEQMTEINEGLKREKEDNIEKTKQNIGLLAEKNRLEAKCLFLEGARQDSNAVSQDVMQTALKILAGAKNIEQRLEDARLRLR